MKRVEKENAPHIANPAANLSFTLIICPFVYSHYNFFSLILTEWGEQFIHMLRSFRKAQPFQLAQ
jgi:hypothetical protein